MDNGSRKDSVRARWGLASSEMRWPWRLESWVTDNMKGIKGLLRFVLMVARKLVLVRWGHGAGLGGQFPSSGPLPFDRRGN